MFFTGTEFLLGGTLLGTLAALWSRLKIIFNKFKSLFVVTVIINNRSLKRALCTYIYSEFECSKLTNHTFIGKNEYIRKLEKNRLVAYEILPAETTIWRKGLKFLLIKISSNNGKDGNIHLLYANITINFIRGMFDLDDLIENAVMYHSSFSENSNNDRFYITKESGNLGFSGSSKLQPPNSTKEVCSEGGGFNSEEVPIGSKYEARPVRWDRDQLGLPKKKDPLGFLALSDDILDAYYEAVRWKREEKWFKSRGVPWKRGWLLWGGPGTGKTAFVRALAQDLNMPVIAFDLSTMSNDDFKRSWENNLYNTPCIFLFEDIDAVFEGRKNISCSNLVQGLSFDCFLNTLDGIENTEGIFVIVTTNRIDTIDSALGNIFDGMSTRPGRIDRLIKFDILNEEGRWKLANRIFEGLDKNLWEEVILEGERDTGAQFQARCCKLALKLWEKSKERMI